ncbi:MAG: phosphatase PAP2 family protein [Clostridiales bacterium]|nr:phosphatase PAP2 family protein [Clostridiales bacterium]
MKKKNLINFLMTAALFASFALWTFAVAVFDVKPIGPCGSPIGFAALNGFSHALTGVNMTLYTFTDWLGLFSVGIMFAFAVTGLVQLIKRRSLFKVDLSLIVLGETYLLVFLAYLLFEVFVVNRRPVLIEGFLEASYPSSTTLLVMTVIPTAMIELRPRIKSKTARGIAYVSLAVFALFTVIGRTVSGVHWLTDIIGGLLLAAAIDMLYFSVRQAVTDRAG